MQRDMQMTSAVDICRKGVETNQGVARAKCAFAISATLSGLFALMSDLGTSPALLGLPSRLMLSN